ncbi:MAG: hypothetical protein RR253_01585, partial [Oscillospiraceae bacterium]
AIAGIIDNVKVQQMEEIAHHIGGVTCLEHCIFVSYLSFVMCKKLRLDATSAARGGLLHDLYLCDWSKTDVGRFKRLFIHPGMALANANGEFAISLVEQDIIANHMWPLTISKIPHHRVSIIVSLADKICAVMEMSGAYSRMKTRSRLTNFNHRYTGAIFAD